MRDSRTHEHSHPSDSPPFVRLADTRAYKEPPKNPFGLRQAINGSHGGLVARQPKNRFIRQLPSPTKGARVELTVDDLDARRDQLRRPDNSPDANNRKGAGARGNSAKVVSKSAAAATQSASIMRELTVGRIGKPENAQRYRSQSNARLIPPDHSPGDYDSMEARLRASQRHHIATQASASESGPPGLASASLPEGPSGAANGLQSSADGTKPPQGGERVWLRRVEVEADATLDAVQAHTDGKLTLPITSPTSGSPAASTVVVSAEGNVNPLHLRQAQAPSSSRRKAEAERVLQRHGWVRQEGGFSVGAVSASGLASVSNPAAAAESRRGTSAGQAGSQKGLPKRASGKDRPRSNDRDRDADTNSVRLRHRGGSGISTGGAARKAERGQAGQGRGVSGSRATNPRGLGVGRDTRGLASGEPRNPGQNPLASARPQARQGSRGRSRGGVGGARSIGKDASSQQTATHVPSRRQSQLGHTEVSAIDAGAQKPGGGGEPIYTPTTPVYKADSSAGPSPDLPASPSPQQAAGTRPSERAGRFGVDPPEIDRADTPLSLRHSRRRHDLAKGSQHNALVAVRRMRLMTQLALAEEQHETLAPGSPRVKPTVGAARYLFDGGLLPATLLAKTKSATAAVPRVPMQRPPAHLLRQRKDNAATELSTDGSATPGTSQGTQSHPHDHATAVSPSSKAARAAERRNARMLRAVSSLQTDDAGGDQWGGLRDALVKEQHRLREDAGATSTVLPGLRVKSVSYRRQGVTTGRKAKKLRQGSSEAPKKKAPKAIDAGAARIVAEADIAIDSSSDDEDLDTGEESGTSTAHPVSGGRLLSETGSATGPLSPGATIHAKGGQDERGHIPGAAFAEVSQFLGASMDGGTHDSSSPGSPKQNHRALMPFELAAERLCGKGSVRVYDDWMEEAVHDAGRDPLTGSGNRHWNGNRQRLFALERCPPGWRLFMSLYEDKIMMRHTSSLGVAFRAWRDRAIKQFKLRRAMVAFVKPKLKSIAVDYLRRWHGLRKAIAFHRRRLRTKALLGWAAEVKEQRQARLALRLGKHHWFRRQATAAVAALKYNAATEREQRRRTRNAGIFLFVHRGRDYVQRWALFAQSQRVQRQLRQLAADYFTHRYAKELISRWRRQTSDRKTMRAAMQKAQRHSVRRYFVAWKGVAAERSRERVQMVDAGIYHSLRISLKCFCSWRDASMDRIRDKAASRAFELRSQRRGLRLWRKRAALTVSLRARGVVASAGRAGRLVSAAWEVWGVACRLQASANALRSWQRVRGLSAGVQALMNHAITKQDRREKTAQASIFARFRLLRLGWQRLNDTFLERRKERAAAYHHVRGMAGRAIRAWRAEAKRAAGVRALQAKFEVAVRRVRTQEMLAFWRRWSRNRRWGRSAVAVADVFRQRVSLGGAWVALAHNLATVRRARDGAERMLVRRELTGVRRCLRSWHSRTFRWEIFARKVVLRQMRRGMQLLKEGCREQKRVRMLDAWMLNMQRERVQTQAFSRWVRFVQVGRVGRSATEAADNWYMRKLCLKVIRGWYGAMGRSAQTNATVSHAASVVGTGDRPRDRSSASGRGVAVARRSGAGSGPSSVRSTQLRTSSRSSSRRSRGSVAPTALSNLMKPPPLRQRTSGPESEASSPQRQRGVVRNNTEQSYLAGDWSPSRSPGRSSVVMATDPLGPRPTSVRQRAKLPLPGRSNPPNGYAWGSSGSVSRASDASLPTATAAPVHDGDIYGTAGKTGNGPRLENVSIAGGGSQGGKEYVRRKSNVSISARRRTAERSARRPRDMRELDRLAGRREIATEQRHSKGRGQVLVGDGRPLQPRLNAAALASRSQSPRRLAVPGNSRPPVAPAGRGESASEAWDGATGCLSWTSSVDQSTGASGDASDESQHPDAGNGRGQSLGTNERYSHEPMEPIEPE